MRIIDALKSLFFIGSSKTHQKESTYSSLFPSPASLTQVSSLKEKTIEKYSIQEAKEKLQQLVLCRFNNLSKIFQNSNEWFSGSLSNNISIICKQVESHKKEYAEYKKNPDSVSGELREVFAAYDEIQRIAKAIPHYFFSYSPLAIAGTKQSYPSMEQEFIKDKLFLQRSLFPSLESPVSQNTIFHYDEKQQSLIAPENATFQGKDILVNQTLQKEKTFRLLCPADNKQAPVIISITEPEWLMTSSILPGRMIQRNANKCQLIHPNQPLILNAPWEVVSSGEQDFFLLKNNREPEQHYRISKDLIPGLKFG